MCPDVFLHLFIRVFMRPCMQMSWGGILTFGKNVTVHFPKMSNYSFKKKKKQSWSVNLNLFRNP